MCGRYTLTISAQEINLAFPWLTLPGDAEALSPRYNIAPSQPIAVVPNDGKKQLDFYTWGLIPFWTKDVNKAYRMITPAGKRWPKNLPSKFLIDTAAAWCWPTDSTSGKRNPGGRTKSHTTSN